MFTDYFFAVEKYNSGIIPIEDDFKLAVRRDNEDMA